MKVRAISTSHNHQLRINNLVIALNKLRKLGLVYKHQGTIKWAWTWWDNSTSMPYYKVESQTTQVDIERGSTRVHDEGLTSLCKGERRSRLTFLLSRKSRNQILAQLCHIWRFESSRKSRFQILKFSVQETNIGVGTKWITLTSLNEPNLATNGSSILILED